MADTVLSCAWFAIKPLSELAMIIDSKGTIIRTVKTAPVADPSSEL